MQRLVFHRDRVHLIKTGVIIGDDRDSGSPVKRLQDVGSGDLRIRRAVRPWLLDPVAARHEGWGRGRRDAPLQRRIVGQPWVGDRPSGLRGIGLLPAAVPAGGVPTGRSPPVEKARSGPAARTTSQLALQDASRSPWRAPPARPSGEEPPDHPAQLAGINPSPCAYCTCALACHALEHAARHVGRQRPLVRSPAPR